LPGVERRLATDADAYPFASPAFAQQRGFTEWAASKPVLFVADLQGNVVRLYDPNDRLPPLATSSR
jgi:hypothetical protein